MALPYEGRWLPSLSYLLRIWASVVRGEVIWQASLEDPHTRHRVGFFSLDELASYLREKTGESEGGAEEAADGVARSLETGEDQERATDEDSS